MMNTVFIITDLCLFFSGMYAGYRLGHQRGYLRGVASGLDMIKKYGNKFINTPKVSPKKAE